MPIIASNEGGTPRKPIPEGVYIATCISIIDLGDQYNEEFKKTQRKVMVMWELHDDDLMIEIEGEMKPRYTSREYTLSLNEKSTLYKDLIAWRGKSFTPEELKAFDLKNILGVACQLQITHIAKGEKTYANISSLMKIPKGMQAPKPISELTYFDIDTSGKTEEDKRTAMAGALKTLNEDLPKLPEWIQTKIRDSETAKNLWDGINGIADNAASAGVEAKDGDFEEITGSDDLPF